MCSNFNWTLYFVISPYVKVLSFCHLFLSLCTNFFAFVINDHKGSILDRLRLSMSINRVRIIFPNWIQSRMLAKHITRFDPRTSFFTPHFKGYLDHVELNTYSSLSRSNTRFTSPQTCYMLPLDQVKHRSNSGTIQASNLFDFHEWAHRIWGMTRYTKHVLSKGCMPCQSTFTLDCSKERHVI
jgi:hypothetical protein